MDCRIGLLPSTEVKDAMAAVERCIQDSRAGDTFLANNPPEVTGTASRRTASCRSRAPRRRPSSAPCTSRCSARRCRSASPRR
ncbi:hypothetical protein [Teichococcus aestuarii]|uniref:hypothetical protein n=1 Tax=Teichococcus aestuarii TaxID=568898 RepID=UPI0036191A3A